MSRQARDKEHLFRLAALFVGAFIVFLVARAFFVPKGFGMYGHYRAGALDDNAGRPLHYAGRAACAECHSDVVDWKGAGPHKTLSCEGCHGALAGHVADPTTVTPEKPDAGVVCRRCHEKLQARPSGFPQIDVKEHAGEEICTSCHNPHRPDQPPEARP